MAKPYFDSDELIKFVKQSISFPINQSTFTEEDILRFANAEMKSAMVPSVLQFHEEFFVYKKDVPLVSGRKKYSIPDRAIGQKFRDVFFVDTNGNEFEMTQISSEDRSHFSDNYSTGNLHKFYIENNSIVLLTGDNSSFTGSLRFSYYLRPNQMVATNRAAISQSFTKIITVENSGLNNGDTLTIGEEVYTAGTDFNIEATSIATATNLTLAINTKGTYSANNGTVSTAIITVDYNVLDTEFSTSNESSFAIQVEQGIRFDQVPSHISNGSKIDFLETNSGHKIFEYDIVIPSNGISGNIISFNSSDVPMDFVIGDYICSEHECIIPMIPDDLHITLAERVSARILHAIGDMGGLKAAEKKISDLEFRQGTLIDNRAEGAPQKINNTHSLLRYGKRRRHTRRG